MFQFQFRTNCKVKFHLFYFSTNYDGLLRADFLKKLNATNDFGSQRCITFDVEIIYEGHNIPEVIGNIQNFHFSLTTPPRIQIVVKIPGELREGLGVLDYSNITTTVELM